MENLSRGARQYLQLLTDLASGSMGRVVPGRDWLKARLKTTYRTLDRWTAELKFTGHIAVQKRGRDTAEYTIQTCQNGKSSGKSSGKSKAPYLREFMSTTETAQRKEAGIAQVLNEHRRMRELVENQRRAR